MTGKVLPRGFCDRPATGVAPELLNKVLHGPAGSGRIIEVEAYMGQDDPGSHGYRGPTPRTEIMYGPPGYLYVYFTYGMHWCANVVCGPEGECGAVLLRAVEPLTGIDAMRSNRTKPLAKPMRDRDLANGPAKLCQALGIGEAQLGLDVTSASSEARVRDDGVSPPNSPTQTKRIGLSQGRDLPWRWHVPDHPGVSRSRVG